MKSLHNASNLTTIKNNNRSLILRVLNSQGKVSRAELSRITGLTKTSITNIISELLDMGIINETGTQDSQSGRKPILLNLSRDSLYALGVYISRDFVYANVVNLGGDIIKERRHYFNLTENERSFLNGIFATVSEVLQEAKINEGKFLGAGIASIGPLDIRNGIILDPPNFRGLKSIPIVKEFKEKFSLPVFLDNDMNASAIAEKLFGGARNISNFIYVGITNGIGAGIILNDDIFRGCNGFAGEIGHTTIDVHGERCACGNLGCFELYASIPAVVKQVKSSVELGVESKLDIKDNITWNDIVRAASEDDPICKKAIERLSYYLSVGLVNLVNSFDPQVIFLGHEAALAGELIVKPLNEMINGNFLFRNSKHVSIELSSFRDYSPCVGAAAIVLNKFFNGEI